LRTYLSLPTYPLSPHSLSHPLSLSFFFFTDTATTEIYTLSLHDALTISFAGHRQRLRHHPRLLAGDAVEHHVALVEEQPQRRSQDRKSTRLNSSHVEISYAVFCLKKKKKKKKKI